ncbi:hypothetical protein SAICODRAFT_71244 [Saitoella complicata NRRL Y-17804]|uniref:uncharacterized protein n=1 Tax=Saitoella complicata (strain BCRC 22490 / CBS 7301 / JCM 7358 / NBRC 10748 / NRRL Y-17804) TaxID=698492 RepID=UPI0008680EC5|nr:uncharacterized protein SAICODRAFT_71244 [Saitoella complicata NRRL Y-17804]ODQ53259.1 hypothetical protein SAICODRAFT_71244 [Saitoella complicata NRRL Y-17804]
MAWLNWWIKPVHAKMLFRSYQTIHPNLLEGMPDTTNAEESLHWKIYLACGTVQSHRWEVLEGLSQLYRFAQNLPEHLRMI